MYLKGLANKEELFDVVCKADHVVSIYTNFQNQMH